MTTDHRLEVLPPLSQEAKTRRYLFGASVAVAMTLGGVTEDSIADAGKLRDKLRKQRIKGMINDLQSMGTDISDLKEVVDRLNVIPGLEDLASLLSSIAFEIERKRAGALSR